MKIKEAGHIYTVAVRHGDGRPGFEAEEQTITFVNREPGHEHDGTTTQEVIRALIDRTQYCDHCLPWKGNELIVHHLRMALALHETRAVLRKVETGELRPELLHLDHKDQHWLLPESYTGPKYGFDAPDRAKTNTGSLAPGQPCHTPITKTA